MYSCIDLFSGCGGFSEGFKQAGFEIVLANELNENFAEIYKQNNPETRMVVGDIHEVKKEMIALLKDIKVDVLIGGFPCQAFSMSGLRDPNDPRAFLYKEFLWMVDKIKPTVFVGENVKGMLSARQPLPDMPPESRKMFDFLAGKLRKLKDLSRSCSQRPLSPEEQKEFDFLENNRDIMVESMRKLTVPILPMIKKEIKAIGYNSVFKVLNAARFGVPQKRERTIIIGTVDPVGSWIFPEETHFSRLHISRGITTSLLGETTFFPYETVDRAISDLEDAEEDENFAHVFSSHSDDFLEKIKNTKQGSSVFDNFKEAYHRLFPDRVSPTVKENHSGVFIHPRKDRLLSVRELARLQSFDDHFILRGKKTHLLTVIGNAVPPLLSYSIACKVKFYLDGKKVVD